MGVLLALLLAAAFGAGDQYLGSLALHPWGADAAGLSAPWLLLAFLAGCSQRMPRRAALLGLACTAAALAGYWLMTDSPAEGAQYTLANLRGFFVSNGIAVFGGLLTGPLFGWFGQQWRTRRALAGALVSAAALCLEPLVRRVPFGSVRYLGHGYLVTQPIGSRLVVIAEIAAGLLFAAYVFAARRTARPQPPLTGTGA